MDRQILAYITGIALGDGNLSNPNGRAVRLRISCDKKYTKVIEKITHSLQILMPGNKVSLVRRKNCECVDISCYSKKWESLLGWRAKDGSKEKQEVSVPEWIKSDKTYTINCLRGLFETDGSVYMDRKYIMANFTTIIPALAGDVMKMIESIGFKPNLQKLKTAKGNIKHTIRISKNATEFINLVGIEKS